MGKEELTSSELLAFARHDFLNDLQIILMHLDLGNPSEARKVILKTTKAMGQRTLLSGFGFPKVQQWLLTFDWVYTAFRSTLTCAIKKGPRNVNDDTLVAYLEAVFNEIEEVIDPLSDYDVHFDIFAEEKEWSITITINGELPETKETRISPDNLKIEETISHNLWVFKLIGQ
ncbi:Spo0B domain-containing protein [Sporosarcina sp. Marseille-Q4063]|uniref:Spo0B domain-containing protein n=1 Tax=Sporosarcina sp. Marseille-Q4063 TaxID=2810514 RepID=UPI001BB0ACDD|nr:Spo0B domain-containing protein [Sporosarcina sp. Marseille-Q4063]QUW22486.1 Spo0B domain-containing protein [Sporosarcina sp. Marseille-Q4063]